MNEEITPEEVKLIEEPVAPETEKVKEDKPETIGINEYKNIQAGFSRVSQENAELKRNSENAQRDNESLRERLRILEEKQMQPQTVELDELDIASEDFEELKPVVSRVKKLEANIAKQTKQREQDQAEMRQQQEVVNQHSHKQMILNVHPDAFTLANTVDFQGWISRQPGYMQNIIRNGSADDVIQVLTQYKSQSSTNLENAKQVASPTSRGVNAPMTNNNRARFTPEQITNMSDAEFIKNETAINEAMAAGQIY